MFVITETESLGMFALVSDGVCVVSFSLALCTPSVFVTAIFAEVPRFVAAFPLLESNVSGELGMSDEDGFLEIFRSLNLRTFR